ncbi:hypothetical protein FRC20_011745 [Serendipita sp. 405]|nr:hypothetical protein FRC20_011745 [Serendipita sp. 405]
MPLPNALGPFASLIAAFYVLIQKIIVLVFKPRPPRNESPQYRGRIAVVGAGLSGISSAAHSVAHGFDVVIFETNDKVGGIWANVNSTSGLQLNSLLYRFHPAVVWSRGFPFRDEILKEMSRIWKEYGLESKTRFNTPVTVVQRVDPSSLETDPDTDPWKNGHARWTINDGREGVFDAIIVTVGTCGAPKWVNFKGLPDGFVESKRAKTSHTREAGITNDREKSSDSDEDSHSEKRTEIHGTDAEGEAFTGPILHSSELDSPEASQVQGKTVVIIGSGASGVEAAETALQRGAKQCVMIARDDKWIISRNMFIDVLIAMQPFGREMPLSFIWESFLQKWHYRGVEDLVPAHRGLFEGTPVVNDNFLSHVRSGACLYIRGDTRRLTSNGVLVNTRTRTSHPEDKGEEKVIPADVVVLATGFERPSTDFLPRDLFPEGYSQPDLYLQNFSTEDWSILLTNSSYINAIGTVGHFHIGIYTRILLVLLLDAGARPAPKDMKLWVDLVRYLKRGAKGGALTFFTYMELTIWLVLFHIVRPDRLPWLPFVLFGWGVLPKSAK